MRAQARRRALLPDRCAAAEGARPEEFDVDLHEMRKRALNRLPNQDSMELPLSDEERRCERALLALAFPWAPGL